MPPIPCLQPTISTRPLAWQGSGGPPCVGSASRSSCFSAARSAAAQNVPVAKPLPAGTVVRLTLTGGAPARVRLLEPLHQTSTVAVYCRYPSPGCAATPPRDTLRHATAGLVQVERRRGTQARRGAVIGALVGTAGALVVLVGTAEVQRADASGRALVVVLGTGLVWGGVGALDRQRSRSLGAARVGRKTN
jgi:hypothetical protein